MRVIGPSGTRRLYSCHDTIRPSVVPSNIAFEPDIIATGPEPAEIALIAEVKTTSPSMDEVERQLKDYMTTVSSPVDLLVTPEQLRIYRDQYLSSGDSVNRVAELDVRPALLSEA